MKVAQRTAHGIPELAPLNKTQLRILSPRAKREIYFATTQFERQTSIKYAVRGEIKPSRDVRKLPTRRFSAGLSG